MELNNDTLRKLRGLILYTVILVAAAVNYKGILSVGQTLLGFIWPFILGAAIAFILNVPMRNIERHLTFFKKESRLRRPVSLVITLVLVSGVLILVLFVVACFVSVSMGTSVGTITLLTPIAAAVAEHSGFSLPLCVATVIGGAMFGDNLSFISDTTIAACTTQDCQMRDKFRTNFAIALPAALATLVLILLISLQTEVSSVPTGQVDLVLLIPYILVLVGGIVGLNVFVVLLVGILTGAAITLINGSVSFVDLLVNMGTGVSGMSETILVTLLVASLCGMIRAYGGFEALLNAIRRIFKGQRGGQLGIGLLVGLMDISTANNTVAIVMAGPIAKEIAEEYGISPRKSASLLDTFSCIFQGIIPYGAQMLIAVSTALDLGGEVSAFQVIPYLFYPYLLAVSSVVFILVWAGKAKQKT